MCMYALRDPSSCVLACSVAFCRACLQPSGSTLAVLRLVLACTVQTRAKIPDEAGFVCPAVFGTQVLTVRKRRFAARNVRCLSSVAAYSSPSKASNDANARRARSLATESLPAHRDKLRYGVSAVVAYQHVQQVGNSKILQMVIPFSICAEHSAEMSEGIRACAGAS